MKEWFQQNAPEISARKIDERGMFSLENLQVSCLALVNESSGGLNNKLNTRLISPRDLLWVSAFSMASIKVFFFGTIYPKSLN